MERWVQEQWKNVLIKLKIENILIKSTFHYSIIPFTQQIRKPQRNSSFDLIV
jgi:hypothetical protein